MKARWVLHEPSPAPGTIGRAIVASWWPGRFHVVSTLAADGKSAIARLTESLTTGKSFDDVKQGRRAFVTQIFRCDREGIPLGLDCSEPLFEKEYATRKDAEAGHKDVVELFASGRL